MLNVFKRKAKAEPVPPVETKRMVQIVMDHTGDTRHEFASTDAVALDEAEKRFKELTGKGFLAASLNEDGTKGQRLKAFDPTVTQTVFIPRLQGG